MARESSRHVRQSKLTFGLQDAMQSRVSTLTFRQPVFVKVQETEHQITVTLLRYVGEHSAAVVCKALVV
jgi:hypothetical protein